MTQFVGRHNGLALFSTPENSVVVDTEFGLVVEAGDTDALLSSRQWIPTGEKFDENIGELVELSISNLKSRALIASSNARLYTIPAGVKAEAKKALEWHAENHRGGTPVGLNTARMLANESQIGLHKVRHIAKYFPRHEVDKKGKGYQPGEDGFPSNGRIAWALWGGDAGRKWASTIVEREDKKPTTITADGSQIINLPGKNVPDLNDFIDSYEQPETVMPEFLARVCLDGSGIDRLYKIDLDGCTHVWDGSGWDNLENPDCTVWDIDNTLDADNDSLPNVSHILIDPDSAIIIGARLNTNPFKNVSVGDIDADEAQLASFAISDIDWDFIDSAIIADASAPVANGSAPTDAPTPSNVSDINMDGIFDKNPSEGEKPDIKLGDDSTPPMDANSVHGVLSNFPVWVKAERKSGVKAKPTHGVHHPLVTKWVAEANGLDMPIQPANLEPVKNPIAQPVTADGAPIPSPADVKNKLDENKAVEDSTHSAVSPKTSDVQPLYFAIVSPDDPRAVMDLISVVPASSSNPQPMVYSRKNGQWIRNPKTLADLKSATPPPVVPLDPSVLQDVLKQVDGIQASALFSYDHALMVMFGPRVDVMATVGNKFFEELSVNPSNTALVAAKGGFDKNNGKAEKLRRYWTFGRGGAKIRWGQPGDWSRCVRHLSKFLGVRAKGYCQLRHHDALGIYTGTHAKLYHEGHGNVPKLSKRNFSNDEFIMEEVLTKNYGKPTVVTDKDLMMPMDVIHGMHDHMYDEDWQPESDIHEMLNDPAVCEEMCNYSSMSDHSDEDPCWNGYKQIGFKDKDGKHVPNCVNASGAISASGADLLKNYWTTGDGGNKIRWSEFGDWSRCVRNLDKYFGSRSRGYCALLAQEVNGSWVGDAENKQFFARLGFGSSTSVSAFSTDVINSSEKVLEISELSAKTAELRNRISLVAAGSLEDINAPVEGARFSIPLVIPEEHESGDGRSFQKGAIEIRELPLPLMWQIKTADGHQGSVVVGRIDSMERIENGIGNAQGVFDTGIYGSEAQRLVQGGFLRGVSADMDKFEAKEIKDKKKKSSDEAAESDSVDINNGKLVISKARVMGVTIVPKPAFQECQISVAPAGGINQEEIVIPNGIYADDADASDALSLVACGFVAGAIPVSPPSEWFNDPKLDKPTPLIVDDTGRVFGHIAAWHVDHIGLSFGTKPPRSRSNYSYFHTGVVRADDGKDYPVGQLTLAGGHASLEASAAQAAKHYDDTASAIADVHAGEDKFGIWVAGALRPSAQPEQIRALRASAPSGDWRPIQGSLELVAVCQVNVPGFPIARARVASGAVMALVAAGAATLAKLKADPVTELNERMARLEAYSIANRQAELSAIKSKFEDAKTEFGFVSKAERDEAAKKGQAMPDGSYPIRNVDDLKNAIHAFGRAKEEDKTAVKKHIMKRARQLKSVELIPDNWKPTSSASITASLDVMRDKIATITAAGGAGIPKASDIEEAGKHKAATDLLDEVKSQNKGITNKRDKAYASPAPKANVGNPDADKKPAKYTPDTQPRDNRGEFRQVLARLKGDLHLAGLHGVAADVKHAEDLHDAGRHEEAIKAGQAILEKVKASQASVKKKDSLNRLKDSTENLDKSLNRVA